MGHKPFGIRSLLRANFRWRRSGLAAAVLLVLAANAIAQEKVRVVVVYGDNPSSGVIDAVFKAESKDLPGVIEEYGLRLDTIKNVLFIGNKESPYVTKSHQTARLLSAIPFGLQVDASSLDDETRTALSRLTQSYFALTERSHVPESMILSADAVYNVKVNGRVTRINLFIKTKEDDASILNDLLKKPTVIRPSERSDNSAQKSAVFDENELRLVVRAPRHTPETLAASAEFLLKLAEEEELVRQELKKIIEPLVRNLEELNANEFTSGMPNGKQSLDQLPSGIRERLRDSFIDRFRINGYSSEDQAEIAWFSAELVNSSVEFVLFYAAGSESSEPRLRGIAVTRTGS